jgi:hypothetical protein
MKRLFALLILIFLSTGCSIKRIDNKDINIILDNILTKNIQLSNTNDRGYSYYLPQSIRLDDSNDYNKKLYTDGNYYYLYIDTISYYYKTNINYKINKQAYFSKIIDYNNKTGYIEITKYKNKYFIQLMYNYAKVETIVPKEKINNTVANICYILSTLKFKDNIIETYLGENVLDYTEEKFEVLKPKNEKKLYLDYVDLNNTYNELPDEEQIIPNKEQE